MYIIIGLFVFFVIMAGLLITVELYAKRCAKNNDVVIWHMEWLQRTGMRETRRFVNYKWMRRI